MQVVRGRNLLPALTHRFASVFLACLGTVALVSATPAAATTFNFTGSYTSFTIEPGTYRITVYGAQGGDAGGSASGEIGGFGAEASAIYQINQPLDVRIGVGGAAPPSDVAAGGGGASFVDFTIGDPGIGVLLLIAGGGGGAFEDGDFAANGGDGKTTSTDPNATGAGRGGGGGPGYDASGQSVLSGGDGGTSLLSGGAPGQRQSPGGFGGGGGGGFTGGDAGFDVFGDHTQFFASQGGTSFVNDNPDDCPGGPVCFVGGLVPAVGTDTLGQGFGNGSVIIEPVSGLAVPEPSTWAMPLIGFSGIGLAASRRRQIGRPRIPFPL
jgi:Glycine rich protein/PEP-CTERM motif